MDKHSQSVVRYRERGQVLPAIALIAIVLLGIAALGTDAFLLYWNRQSLQRASDAASLAGAAYLADTTFTGANASCSYSTQAQQAACTYALANGVLSSEIQSISVAGDGKSITVATSRTVPATFARLLGFTQFTVAAQATAGITAASRASDLIPIGLDDATPYTYGQAIVMHNGSCGAGCWGAVDYVGSGSSGSALDTELANGCGCDVSVGTAYNSIPGAKVGDVKNVIGNRVSTAQTAAPAGTWQSHSPTDGRVATVGLVTWGSSGGSTQTATVDGFAEVWLTTSSQTDFPSACSGMSASDICAIFIRQVASGAGGSASTDTGTMRTLLLQ